MYFARLSCALGTAESASAHTATVVHCAAADHAAVRRRSRSIASMTGAASGNNPTGPFDSTAAITERPDATPPAIAIAIERRPRAMNATAAVTNTHTVVSSRLPTIDHETTGGSIQK